MDEVSQVREKIDIVSLISEYIPLKKLGRNFKANCPFHNEKTPSFVVSPERQIWHCFGCGKGGDAFTFLMEYESMEFPESLRVLAKKAGIELKESSFNQGVTSEKEKIYKINKATLKFYNYILTEHKAGLKALDYLIQKRKLNKGIINTFELGFAPIAANSLSTYLINKKNYNQKDLIQAGVSININGRLLDFFRNRIIFPLYDHRGNVVGFSGRSLLDKDMPKYINTKETLAYHKGSLFFGLNLAKDEIKQKQDAIIVEGEFDMISLFTEGIKNTIAIKGTALTADQVNLLSRFTPKVTLCLDQDSAGFEATKRSLEPLEKKGLTTNIIILKNAKDPDEAIKENPIEFKKALRESINVYDFLISYLVSDGNLNIDEKKKITDTLLPLFSQVTNEIVKEHYLKKLSQAIDISLDSVNKELDKIQKQKQEDKIVITTRDKRTRREILEEYLLALVVQGKDPKEIITQNKNVFLKYKFTTPSFQKIIEALYEYFKSNIAFDNKKFSNFLSSELIKSFDFCYIYSLPTFKREEKYQEEVKKVTLELLNFYVKDRIRQLSDEIAQKEKEKDLPKAQSLRKEFSSLLALLKNP